MGKYENYKIGGDYLIPNFVKEKIERTSNGVKRLNECVVFYEDTEKIYLALKVLNNTQTAKDHELSVKSLFFLVHFL